MKVALGRLTMIVTLAVAGVWSSVCKADQVLFWMLDDPLIETKESGPVRASEMGENIDSARVAATKAGSDTIYLDLYYRDDGGHWVIDPTADPRVDTVSVVAGRIDGGYARSSLESTLGSDYALYSFAIELGVWGGDDGNTWIAAAYSQSESYEQIQSYTSFQVDVPTSMLWTGSGFVATPEPSSGLLLILGVSLLSLRRKRRIMS